MDATDIVVALLGLLGVIVTALFGYLSKIKAEKGQKNAEEGKKEAESNQRRAEKELILQRSGLDLTRFLSKWDKIQTSLKLLMEETHVDRFLILRAWNGAKTPKWTTAIFQYREGSQQPVSYIHFELDTDYVERLLHIHQRPLSFKVDDIPESAIRRVYKAEGVKASLWVHLETAKIDEDHAIMTYCSFATHEDKIIDETTAVRCELVANMIRSFLQGKDEAPLDDEV